MASCGRLIDLFGERADSDHGLGLDIKVNHFLAHGGWALPTPTSGDLILTWAKITTEITPMKEFEDEVVWTADSIGRFTIESAYEIVHWHDLHTPPDLID